MKISLITAVYNRVNTIGHTIESIQSQTYTNTEHVIQDGGSTDGTLAKIQKMKTATSHFVSEPDAGIYDAINRGIVRASGDIIGVLHSDDFFSDNRVLERVALAFTDDTVDGVYGDLDYVAVDEPTRIVRRWRSGKYSRSKLQRGWMPPHPTLFLRREVFERWGLYDTNLRIAADYDAILRYLLHGRINIVYVPEVLVKMRVGGESNRSLLQILRKSREDWQVIRRNGAGGVCTLVWKNISKIEQFLNKKDRDA